MMPRQVGKLDRAALIVLILLVLPVAWFALMLAPIMMTDPNLAQLLDGLNAAMSEPLRVRWVDASPKYLLLFVGLYVVSILAWASSRRRTKPLEEYGSARWGDARRITKKYAAHDPAANLLLTEHFRLGLDGRVHRRNLNVLVVGGSGSGKTRFYAKPNLMQGNTSFVVTDPKGELCRDTGNLMKRLGYNVKVIDLINMNQSFGYNPLQYITSDNDVLRLVTNLIRNTTPKGANTNDPFWGKSETALLQALLLYLVHEAPEDERNFGMVMEMLQAAEVREEDENFKSDLDILFDRLAMLNPDHIAVKQYRIFKMAAGKTAKSILVSVGVRLATFNLSQVTRMTDFDEMEIPSIGERKTVVYCCIPDNDSSFNYLIGMFYTQVFQQLYHLADYKYDGRLPVHVHFVMDEFANVALPDDFEKLLATMRSREISVSIIIQNMAQLKALFKDNWESLVGNCDTFLYLGGNEQSTHEYVSKLMGKGTIDTTTHGLNKGRNGSYSDNYQQTGRELLTSDEVRMLDNRYALLFMRGERPIADEKYNLLKHPNIGETPDCGGKPYRYDGLETLPRAVSFDADRAEDYLLLDGDEFAQMLNPESDLTDEPIWEKE
jgi:type IV secretion system protein VirD4